MDNDDDQSVLTPNLKMIGRDKAHSFRRLMTRPITTDGYITETMDMFVQDKRCIPQKIHNSHELTQMFGEEVASVDNDAAYSNRTASLRAAKHRFESLSSPLGRILLNMTAFIATVQRIGQTRTDSTGKQAVTFLRQLSSERLLQVGLLSDAMDECMLLIRSVDCEEVDVAEVPQQIQGFVDRLHALFGSERRALSVPGYTKHVIDLLTDGKVAFFVDNEFRRLRVINAQAALDRIFDRMRCWMNLVLETLRTEWPHFSLFAALGVFGLKKTSAKSALAASFGADDVTGTQRLAKVFGVDNAGFHAELERLRPVAARIFTCNYYLFIFCFVHFLFCSRFSMLAWPL